MAKVGIIEQTWGASMWAMIPSEAVESCQLTPTIRPFMTGTAISCQALLCIFPFPYFPTRQDLCVNFLGAFSLQFWFK